jgi:hypothetical protein
MTTTLGDFLYITDVQLEVGSLATPFERKTTSTVIQECQRYYEKSYSAATAIGTATETNCVVMFTVSYTGTLRAWGRWATPKRIAPTTQLYNTNNGGAGTITVTGWGNTIYGGDFQQDRFYAGVGTVTGTGVTFHYTADAEM